MATTWRSESTNAFIKRFVSSNSSLVRLMKQVHLAMEDIEQTQIRNTMLETFRGSSLRTLSPLDKVCKPFDEGGLNFRRLHDDQNIFLAKAWYRLRRGDSIWGQYMKLKYFPYLHPRQAIFSPTGSDFWRALIGIRDFAESNTHWVIREGNVHFWLDSWIPPRPFLHRSAGQVRFNEFMLNDTWHIERLREFGPGDKIASILSCKITRGTPDLLLWKASPNGLFNFKQTWFALRTPSPKSAIYQCLWNKSIPKSMSFLTWRVLHNWISVDDNLRKRGIPMVSKCQACVNSESLNHLFLECEEVALAWFFFHNAFGIIQRQYSSPAHLLLHWCNLSPSLDHVRLIVVVILFWIIWEARNKSKFDNIPIRSGRLISRVIYFIKTLNLGGSMKAKQWIFDLHLASTFGCTIVHMPRPPPKVIYWCMPPLGTYKLNMDGASRGNPGYSGGGGLLRDDTGHVCFSFGSYFGVTSSILAELKAIHAGLLLCIDKNYKNIQVETDSLLAIQLLASSRHSWELFHLIQGIKVLSVLCQATFRHILREGNAPADFLANAAVDSRQDFQWVEDEMDSKIKAMVILEQLHVPYVRK